jgi:hypothetical protein
MEHDFNLDVILIDVALLLIRWWWGVLQTTLYLETILDGT